MRNLSHFFALAMLVFAQFPPFFLHAQANYYSKSTGNLNTPSTWGLNTDGTGTAPANFNAANRIYNIRNNANPTIAAAWTVTGGGSKIIVGDGTNACNFTIPSGFTCTGTVDVSNNATLTITRTTNPTLGTLNANSTVVFNGTANQTIPAVTYGNLIYSGSAYGTMAGACTILGALSVTSGTVVLDNSASTNYIFPIGALYVTNSGNLDFGSSNYGASAIVNLSGNFTQSGTGNITTSGVSVPNGVLNFSGTTQSIQAVACYYVSSFVLSGSKCTLTGNYGIDGDNTGAQYQGLFTVNSGGTLDCGTNSVMASTVAVRPGYQSNAFVLSSGANLVTAAASGIASSGATGSVQTLTRTFSSGANYTYNGSAVQITGIFTTTPTANTLNNLTINNAAGVTLSQAEALSGALTLTSGLLTTTTTNLLTINNGGGVTGASNASFVNGPIKKIGNVLFTFPVGVSGTGYVPIGISAPSSATDAFQAQYIRASGKALGTITAAGLNHISACDYWILNRTTGSSTVNVTAFWNANNPCGGTYVNKLATIALAHFNGTNWDAWGNNGGVTGNTTAGSVTWNGVSTFSPFALSSTDIFNPLPLILTDFSARAQADGTVGLSWETQEEKNVDHFTIERSTEGVNWKNTGTVAAKGNSSSLKSTYSFTDNSPLPNTDYYRLQIVDNDNNLTYSGIKVVNPSAAYSIRVFPNPVSDQVTIRYTGLSGTVDLRLLDMEGKILLQKNLPSLNGSNGSVSLSVSTYPSGHYLIQVMAAGKVLKTEKLIITKKG